MLNDAREFALWLSPHILSGTARVLHQFYGWSAQRTRSYEAVLTGIAGRSGGAVVQPAEDVADCHDWEDNRILELALASGTVLIVTNDDDLLRMSPWRSIPIVDPAAFVSRVDAMRRAIIRLSRDLPG